MKNLRRTSEVRAAYNRTGLGFLTYYLIWQTAAAASSLLLTVLSVAFYLVFKRPDFALLLVNRGIAVFFSEVLDLQFTKDMLILFSIIGTAAGSIIGIPVLSVILPGKKAPVEQNRLSFGNFLLLMLLAFGLWGIGVFVGNFPAFFGVGAGDPLIGSSDYVRFIYLLYAMLGAPVFEELVFRKILLDRVHVYGQTTAAFVSALFFGLMHGNAAQFCLAFTIGLLFAAVYMKTGKLFYTILMHGIINLSASVSELLSLILPDGSSAASVEALANLENFFGSIVLNLIVAGIVMVFVLKRHPVLRLKKPDSPDANRDVFKNPGMLLALIGGMVMVVLSDMNTMFSGLRAGGGVIWFIMLLPMAAVVVTTLVAMNTVGKRHAFVPVEEGAVSRGAFVPINAGTLPVDAGTLPTDASNPVSADEGIPVPVSAETPDLTGENDCDKINCQ